MENVIHSHLTKHELTHQERGLQLILADTLTQPCTAVLSKEEEWHRWAAERKRMKSSSAVAFGQTK